MGDQQQHYDSLDLPPGFRFYPTDEEIITFYLTPKVLNRSFTARAIGEVDLNKSEPWELPGKATMGEKEWYFYSQKDRKYPTGMRTNRATGAGYWKATGKDKEIYRGAGVLVGMKKTLVFYKGRAPKGEKTNWVMHEYRIEGRLPYPTNQPRSPKDEWVVCRIFNKSSGVKKPVALPVANGGGAGGAGIQRSVSMNMTMGEGYLLQPGNVEAPYYAAAAMPAANFAPVTPSGNANLLNHFGNPTAPQPGMFYQQFGAGAGGFVPPVPANFGYMQGMQVEMGALELRNGDGQSPMVSQDTGLSTEHFATAEASSVVSGRYGGDDRLEAASAATGMDLEGIWKY